MSEMPQHLTALWTDVEADEWLTKRDPHDGSVVARIPVSSASEVDTSVNAARTAATGWARTAPAQRGAALAAVADAVEDAAEDLALLTTREMGRPIAESREGVAAGVGTLRQYAQLGPLHRGHSLAGEWTATDLMAHEPRGVAAVITPWNDPVAASCGLLGAALVTGNTVVYKPSERTPATGWLLAKLMRERLPEGVLRALHGGPAVGARLTQRELDVIAHIGSSATGRQIARAAALTGARTILENGGKDPLLIDDGVDPDWAAGQAALGAFANAGQICTSVERIYVHRRLAEPFLTALVKLAASHETAPLVDRELREVVHRQVVAAQHDGATTLTGGQVPDGDGSYYPATVLADCTQDMTVMTEETFGPVAPVTVVDSFDEGIDLAARGPYGLAATVLTPSIEHAQRAWRELPVGTVKINAVFGGAPGGAAHPRRASGDGYGYGPELLDEFTVTKVVHLAPSGL